jgi:hypothetical protein
MKKMLVKEVGKNQWVVNMSTLLGIYEELHRIGSFCSAADIEDVINVLIQRGYIDVQTDQ